MVEELSKEKPDFMDCFKQSVGWFSVDVVVFTILYLIKFYTDATYFNIDIEVLKNAINVYNATPFITITQIIIKNCVVVLIIILLSLTGYSIFSKIYSLLNGAIIPMVLYTFNFQYPILSLIYIMPHGLIEFPTLFIGLTNAMQLSCDRKNWKIYITRYVMIIIPLFIVAALVEVYITPNVILWYIDTGFLV